jgi:hypothetical protein
VLGPADFRDRVGATAKAIAARHQIPADPAPETPVLSAPAAPAITVSGASR